MKNLQELPKLKDSISYLYIEHAIIEQNDTAIVAIKKEGKIPIPIAAMTCLLLGPGTRVTHAAIRALCDNGCMAIWCGENATRFYAAGIGETRSAKNLLKQAGACMDQDKHLEVAKRMYQIRFSKMKTDGMTLQQLRGREGARMRKIYREQAKKWDVSWDGRKYDAEDFSASDPVNQALSAGNVCLYGLASAVITALGCAPSLGFIHVGHEFSFAYDIADLYKAEVTIPLAFELAAEEPPDLPNIMRRRVRNVFSETKLLERMVKDVKYLLQESQPQEQQEVVYLWDNLKEHVEYGISYGKYEDGI